MAMPAKKRLKLDMEVTLSQASQSSVTSLTPSWHPSQQEPRVEDDGEDDHGGRKREDINKFPSCESYKQYLSRPRDFEQIAADLMKRFGGCNLLEMRPQCGAVVLEWCQRYHHGDPKKFWTLHYEEKSSPGQRTEYRATLVVHLLKNREFLGGWSFSQRFAERAAVEVFRADAEVRKIAQKLPPSQKRIKDKVSLTPEEKRLLRARGIDTVMVVKELMSRVCIHLQRLGCRTAILDGNAFA